MTDYDQRKYDIVVFGATGFTGALTCEYLAEIKDKDLSWALAGRTLSKLEKTRDRLVELDPSLKSLNLLIADTNQPETLDEALSQTRVVISTVGPYTKYGTPLVEACLRQKTHYVDLTGEYGWTKYIIEQHDKEAKEKHVMIVPSCGFDSVPSDMGVYMLSEHMKNKHHLDLASVKMSLIKAVGGYSGGTVQSLMEAATDRSLTYQDHVDPYFLATRRGVDKFQLPPFKRDHDFGNRWQGFFVMSVVNERVVRRSWSIWADRGKSYGNLFSYREYMSFPFVPGLVFTALLYAVVPLFSLMFRVFPSSVDKVKSLLPGSGAGPDAEQRAKGEFTIEFVATAENEPYDEPVRARGTVKGFRDPGYGDTCRMIAESALCIVKSLRELPGKEGGILTPSTAFGQVLIDRLTQHGGMVFDVKDI
ncbi:saccharopine dehydrogenase [Gilbertella persicaria]|uniref:saccharopine dehydrogenase n=1 Tax=Gilbertella persicaria TaxID=101096 RepID=UPI00221F9C52|nr:saccharopine dehydrogenase [Gilbertella persicaria]KAI8083977.1 saccharopine dehydrogenase [Gilbertella persicaria]